MTKLAAPLMAMKARYIPLLAVYFAVGFAGLASVTYTFFVKEQLALSAADLVSIGIWTSLPWSIKMVFGTVIDGVKLFGSNRKAYIFLGATLSTLSIIGLIDHASTQLLITHLGEYLALTLTGLLGTTGTVVADIVADTMAIEVVDDGPTREKELGIIQVLSRLVLSGGALLGASITGYLASTFAPAQVFAMLLVCPAIMVVGAAATRLNPVISVARVNWPILLGGLGFGTISVLSGMFLGSYAQITVFGVALVVIGTMMRSLLREVPDAVRSSFVLAMIAIFLFRVVPGIGPAGPWFYIEQLGFGPDFLGLLNIVSAGASLVILWLLADSITNHSILKTMGVLTFCVTILSLPDILVYYGVHELIGISAKTLVLADTAMLGPVMQLSMIPLGVLIAKNAPDHARAVYISLTASLMNIALVGGDLLTQGLNLMFPVTRTDFTNLGALMVTSLGISTVLSVLGLLILWRARSSRMRPEYQRELLKSIDEAVEAENDRNN